MALYELADTLSPTEDDRIGQAEALVRAYCGWHIAPEREETLTPSGYGLARVFLPSLKVSSVAVTRNMVELFADSDYFWDGNTTVVFPWTWSTDVTTITFTHGFETAPLDVTAVVQAVAQRAVDNPRSLTRLQKGPFSESYSATGANQSTALSLLDAEKAILGPYRIIKVA